MVLYDNILENNDIPDFCFSGIASSLTDLQLHGNLLTEIRRDQFSGLNLLEFLYLGNNQIILIESGKPSVSFSKQDGLPSLGFMGNPLMIRGRKDQAK